MQTREEYLAFARGQAAGSSPTYERLAYAVADDDATLAALERWPRARRQPNLLFGVGRLLGAPVGDPTAYLQWCAEHWDEVTREALVRTTQTNEAARCATLLPALLRVPGPLALLEVGASAGLCLYPDRYRYDYGSGVVGSGDGPVLRCAWLGEPPSPGTVPEVAWRAGLDRHPLDPGEADDLRWLECLVWPEHEERRTRLEVAAAVAAREPARVVEGDMVRDLPDLAAQAPADATLVVVHSAVLAYVDEPTRRRFVETVRDLGARWLANEAPSLMAQLLDAPPQPDRPGPRPFLTALDGEPVGWSAPHGQSYTPIP